MLFAAEQHRDDPPLRIDAPQRLHVLAWTRRHSLRGRAAVPAMRVLNA